MPKHPSKKTLASAGVHLFGFSQAGQRHHLAKMLPERCSEETARQFVRASVPASLRGTETIVLASAAELYHHNSGSYAVSIDDNNEITYTRSAMAWMLVKIASIRTMQDVSSLVADAVIVIDARSKDFKSE